MTKGELWLKRRLEWLDKLERGEVKADLNELDFTANLPKPLPRKEALRYYNRKLYAYWRKRGYFKKERLRVPLQWIKYWVERAYEQGMKDAKKGVEI